MTQQSQHAQNHRRPCDPLASLSMPQPLPGSDRPILGQTFASPAPTRWRQQTWLNQQAPNRMAYRQLNLIQIQK